MPAGSVSVPIKLSTEKLENLLCSEEEEVLEFMFSLHNPMPLPTDQHANKHSFHRKMSKRVYFHLSAETKLEKHLPKL